MGRFLCLAQIDRTRTNYQKIEMKQRSINIMTAEQVGDCRLHLVFDDGMEQTVDFKPFLIHAHHPDIRAYLDPARFSAFRIYRLC